ncbi:hypothetical protein PFISCL1PPCAC_5570, partial [Pristionchus fissidentatus]
KCEVNELCEGIDNALSTVRPVLYRNTDIIKTKHNEKYLILEAVHFELFLPDRPDLRFLAIPMNDRNVSEGDYVMVKEVVPLPFDLPYINVGGNYPIHWLVTDARLHPNCTDSFDD